MSRRFLIVVIAASLLIGGSLFFFVRYRSESPPGYERINFGQTFQAGTMTDTPDRVAELLGRKICLKGYPFPGERSRGITQFLVTPDGNTLYTNRLVLVQLRGNETWEWKPTALAVSGTLALNPNYSETNHGPKYLLVDTTVRVSKTPFGILARIRSGC